MRYALVNNGVIANVVEADTAPLGWLPCGDAAPGWLQVGGGFSPPVNPNRPTIVVVGITADADHAAQALVSSLGEVTCVAGTELTVVAELRGAGGAVLQATDQFRMPLRSRDGRERLLLAAMVKGLITITVPLEESGAWVVSEAMINEALPATAQMSFAGIRIFVVEA